MPVRTPIIYLVFIAGLFSLLFLPLDQLTTLTNEDGVIENIGAIFYAISSIVFGVCFFNSKKWGNRLFKRELHFNYIFLMIGLLFFVAMGEEISWGQRIFSIETPEAINQINAQGELNLHNIDLFHGLNADGNPKEGIASLFTSHRMFNALVLFLFLLIPLLDRFVPAARNVLTHIRFPITPIWMGAFMLGTLIGGKVIKRIVDHPSEYWNHAVSEISETGFALLTIFLALAAYKKLKTISSNS